MPKTTGIIFTSHSVQAIRQGIKTQTRRIVKPKGFSLVAAGPQWSRWHIDKWDAQASGEQLVKHFSPYGGPGDFLWVRETWVMNEPPSSLIFKADLHPCEYDRYAPWKSPLFLKRVDSRITLEITDVRVQRVQDISRDDAAAEGVPEHGSEAFKLGLIDDKLPFHEYDNRSTIENYRLLWEKINGNWDENPWVWCITFRVIEKMQEAIAIEPIRGQ